MAAAAVSSGHVGAFWRSKVCLRFDLFSIVVVVVVRVAVVVNVVAKNASAPLERNSAKQSERRRVRNRGFACATMA